MTSSEKLASEAAADCAVRIGAVVDAAAECAVSPPKPLLEPSPELVAHAGAFLEKRGWLKSVAGEADFAAAAHALAKALLNKRGLVVSGASGAGKSAFARAAFGKTKRGTAFVDLGDTEDVEMLDAEIHPDQRECLLDFNVVLDDMGAEARRSNFGQPREVAGEFVHAYHARGSGVLVVTTNLEGGQFLERYQQRVTTRLMELCVPLKFTGGDKRTKAAANRGAAANRDPAAKGGTA